MVSEHACVYINCTFIDTYIYSLSDNFIFIDVELFKNKNINVGIVFEV